MRSLLLVLPVVLALACAGCADDASPRPAPSQPPLRVFSYEAGLTDWQRVQQPAGRERISVVPAPGGGSAPSERAMRVELRPGDMTTTGGYTGSRAEVYARHATRGDAAERWPDPVGSVRWYTIDLYVPKGFCTSERAGDWLTLTQWKGLNGGSPPVALEIKRGALQLGGKRTRRSLGALTPGRWTQVVVGMKLSPDPKEGWIEVSRDGHRLVPRRGLATMDAYTKDGVERVDPIYLKQGLYRSAAWRCTQVVYFGPTVIGDAPPPASSSYEKRSGA